MKTYEEKKKECQSWTDSEIKGFWGFGPNEYGFLSNFHKCGVFFEENLYPSSENAYMSAKTKDLKLKKQFESISPVEAKKLGRSIQLREDWEDIKLDFMFLIVFDKFCSNADIRKRLIDTGDKYLEETNFWNDKFWGVDCYTGVGENNLGKILMKVRKMLR